MDTVWCRAWITTRVRVRVWEAKEEGSREGEKVFHGSVFGFSPLLEKHLVDRIGRRINRQQIFD